MTRTREEAIDAAAEHVYEGLARQAARAPHDAALAALGPDATDAQINEWIARYRSDDVDARPA